MLEVQDEQEVMAALPANLVMLLAAASDKPDHVLAGVIETYDDEVGARGTAINSGMAENRASCCAVNLRLRPFGRQVARACHEFALKHPGDSLPGALERLRRRHQHIALEGSPAYL